MKPITIVLFASTATASRVTESEAPHLNAESRELDWTPPSYACSTSICPTSTHLCLANPNHPQRTTDDTCAPCQGAQTYWPCDVAGLCYCWDKSNGEKQIPPAPSTKSISDGGGIQNNSNGNYQWAISSIDPCDILTESIFKSLAPMAVAPYTYEGFCEAIRLYNADHPTEGVFNMGNEWNQRMELAAFLGNAMHESDEFKAGREYLMCADQIISGGETYCKPCDVGSFDWDMFKCSASLASEGRAFNSYCQSNLLPPDGCQCDDVFEDPNMEGYVKADQVYFGRGAIQLSWNYNYIRASVALTGAPQTFCQRPDLVATKEEYAWGAGLFFWMENIKNDKTCHQSVLMNSDFGETLDNINGGLECPADDHGWHGKAVQLRLNRYCRAASALGLNRLLSLDGCMDMDKRMTQCLEEGNCNDCKPFVDKIGLVDGGPSQNGVSGDNEAPSSHTDEVSDVQTVDEAVEEDVKEDEHDANTQHQEIETEALIHKPTYQPINPRTNKPTKLYIAQGPCSGDPCFIPPEIKNDPNNTLQFCRNAQGICGVGSAYCNAESTWTAFCHDCDADSPYGCPTFGCSDCRGESQICVGNLNSFNPISDSDCAACAKGQSYWPCDIETAEGCWCYDTALPRVEPAAPSGLELGSKSRSSNVGIGVCGTIIDEDIFNALAPNAAAPFTYLGFCEAVDHYNAHHAEKIFRMGSYQQRLSELAAFLGIASHETDGFSASREYLSCGDNQMVDGELYCKPCAASDYNYNTHTCSVSMLAGDQSYMNFCQPYTTPPDGCLCEYVKQVEATGSLQGHMRANDIFFGRGSIQLSHNFNYIRASASMTGNDATFCLNPEMIANNDVFSWGVGMYLWMDQMSKEGSTSHVSVVRDGDFGAALNITNGRSECPAKEEDVSYSNAVMSRMDHYCNTAKILGAPKLLKLDGCEGLEDVFTSCMANGSCPRCEYWHPDYDHSSEIISTLSTDFTTTTEVTSEGTTATLVDTAENDVSPQNPRPTQRPTRPPRTSKPTISSAQSKSSTTIPTSSLTKEESKGSLSSQFAMNGIAITNQNGNSENEINQFSDTVTNEQIQTIDEETSHANTFAYTSHSKESNAVNTRPRPIANPNTPYPTNQAPSTSPIAKMASGFGDMANWALTSLEDADETKQTYRPTHYPVEEAINVQNIVFLPSEDTTQTTSTEQTTSSSFATDLTSTDATISLSQNMDLMAEMSASTQQEQQISDTPAPTNSATNKFNMNDIGTIEEMNEASKQESPSDDVQQPTGIIAGRIWLKTEDDESIGMRGVLVDIFDCDSQEWVIGTRTASSGDYIFEELRFGGTYHVRISKSLKFIFSDDSNSNVDADGSSECLEISSDEPSHTVDAWLAEVDIAKPSGSVENIDETDNDSNENEFDGISAKCRGNPCSNNECRSKYSFCGSGEEYCNEDSQWTPDCGTIAPTLTPSSMPTTSQPSFIVDREAHCSGEPCEDDDVAWCRSEAGFCGGGLLYCNANSIWLPECTTIEPTQSPSRATNNESSVTPAESQSQEPTASPQSAIAPGWSSFRLPTLAQVDEGVLNTTWGAQEVEINDEELMPTVTDENEEKETIDAEKEQTKHESTFNAGWFDRYSYLDSVAQSSGARSITSCMALFGSLLLGMIKVIL